MTEKTMDLKSLPQELNFAKLVALDENAHPDETTLEADVTTLGRSHTCNIVIPDKTISRLHAKIEQSEARRYIIYDMDSANGTFVNEQRIRKSQVLQNQDQIGLGNSKPLLLFRDPEATIPLSSRLRYDDTQYLFFVDDKPLDLPPREKKLLEYLYNNAYDVCRKENCIEVVWEREVSDYLGDDKENLIRLISNLRKCIKQISDTGFIITRRGVGYMLVLDPNDETN